MYVCVFYYAKIFVRQFMIVIKFNLAKPRQICAFEKVLRYFVVLFLHFLKINE